MSLPLWGLPELPPLSLGSLKAVRSLSLDVLASFVQRDNPQGPILAGWGVGVQEHQCAQDQEEALTSALSPGVGRA